jgi:TetR/AcrR family transcriptional regulator, cholesterol catabolism regulator
VSVAEVVSRPLSPTQAATRRRLLEAARELATEEGYEGVTVRAVAARAGVSAPTAYHHFRSKDHLLVDVLIELVGRTGDDLDARPVEGPTAADRAAATLSRVVANVTRAPDLYVAVTRAYLTGGSDVAHATDAMEATTRRFIDLALEGAELGDDVAEGMADVLESLLFAHMVSLVTGRRTPQEVGPDLERAVRTVLAP